MQLPYSAEAEMTILGTVLNDPNILTKIIDQVDASYFYEPKHRLMWQIISNKHKLDQPITEATLIESLKNSGYANGCASDVYSLAINCTIEEYLPKYISLVKEHANRRVLITKSEQLQNHLKSDLDYDEALESFEKTLSSIKTLKKESKTIDTIMKDAFIALQRNWSGIGLVRSGFKELDATTGGFFPGQLIIIAARTSMGKTSFALSLAHNVMRMGRRIAFLSLEMTSTIMAIKSLSIESGIPFYDIRDGRASSHVDSMMPLIEAARILSDWPYEIEDSIRTLQQIKSWTRQMVHDRKIEILFIDYLGLIQPPRSRDRHLEIGDITRSLKELSVELNIPIVLLAQCNRDVESRKDNRPKLSDLKDSGSIEQDADIVLFIYREHYYDKENADPHDAELILAKQRLGDTKTFKVYYQPQLMHFKDYDE